MVIAFFVRAALANVYVDVRPTALLVLLLLGSITTGLAFGAWLGLRRHRSLDISWRAPLIAGGGISLMTFFTMWVSSHPMLRIGTLPELLAIFEQKGGGILSRSGVDDDATNFLAYQALGVLLAVIVCVLALGLIMAVWSNVEAQLPDKSWFVFAAIHRLLGRVPADNLLVTLTVPALIATLFASGAVHRMLGGGFVTSPPELVSMRSMIDPEEVRVTVRVNEPVVLRAAVHRLHRDGRRGLTLGRGERDCRPARPCRLAFTSRADSGRLALGRYQLRVQATDEGGRLSRTRTRIFRVRRVGASRGNVR
jgi:hypothetical protein